MILTFNNFVMCEPYKNKNAIRTEIRGGFATVVQKNTLTGLKVLANADLGKFQIPEGAMIYVQEELLHDSAFTKKVYKNESDVEFILIPANIIVGYGK